MAANPSFRMLMPRHTVPNGLVNNPSSISDDVVAKAIRMAVSMQIGKIDFLQLQKKIHGFFAPLTNILSRFSEKQVMVQFVHLTINQTAV